MKKSDLIIPSLQSNITIGSQVVFVDSSYTLSLRNGELKKESLGLSEDIFTVIAVNVPLPSQTNNYLRKEALHSMNNCIVYNPSDNSYHFCSEINIKSIQGLCSDAPYTLKYS